MSDRVDQAMDILAREQALDLKVRSLRLHQVVALRLRRWFRRWLGIESDRKDVEDFATRFGENINRLVTSAITHQQSIEEIAKQLNMTTLGAAEITRRLEFYEQQVETLRYAKQRLDSKTKPNGHGLIHVAGSIGPIGGDE